MSSYKAQLIVTSIIEDLSDRRGLKSAWNNVDEDVQNEIRAAWEKTVDYFLERDDKPAEKLCFFCKSLFGSAQQCMHCMCSNRQSAIVGDLITGAEATWLREQSFKVRPSDKGEWMWEVVSLVKK